MCSPTKDTLLGAVIYGRAHLNTLMRSDAIELLLVARSVVNQSLMEPSASLDG